MDDESVLHTVPLSGAKLGACFAFSIVFFAVAIFGIICPERISRLSNVTLIRVLSLITACVFAALAVYFALLLFVQKRALEITTAGIRDYSLSSTILYPWSEIEVIGKGELPWGGGALPYVGLSLRDPEKFFVGKPGRALKTYRALQKKNQPYHVIFAGGWASIQTDELLAVLSTHFAVLGMGTEDASDVRRENNGSAHAGEKS